MAKFDVDGTGARTIVASPYTLMLYEQTFHSSLIADWYDKVDLKRGAEGTEWVTSGVVMSALSRANGGRELPAEVKALVSAAFPAQFDTVLDYTANKWEASLRVLWAMLKTGEQVDRADGMPQSRPVPNFDEWVANLGPVNMLDVNTAVYEETQRGLFRAHADTDK